jgi:protein TonB
MRNRLLFLISFAVVLLLHFLFISEFSINVPKKSEIKKSKIKIKLSSLTTPKPKQTIKKPPKQEVKPKPKPKPIEKPKKPKEKPKKEPPKSDKIKMTTKKSEVKKREPKEKSKMKPIEKPKKLEPKPKPKPKERPKPKPKPKKEQPKKPIKKPVKSEKKATQKSPKIAAKTKSKKIGDDLDFGAFEPKKQKVTQKKSLENAIRYEIKGAALGDRDIQEGMDNPWFEELRIAVENQRVYSAKAARYKLRGIVVVGFTVLADGEITNIAVYGSSGSKILDNFALQTIASLGAFKPIPKELHKQRIDLYMRLVYNN